jgi:hypothetical protein
MAVALQEVSGERECRAVSAGGGEAVQLRLEDDAHVPVAVELHRQVVHEPRGRLAGPALPIGSEPQADHDGGPATRLRRGLLSPDRGLRSVGQPCPAQEGDVAAAREQDAHRVLGPPEQVVALERPPQAPGLDADDRVGGGVEVRPAPEDLDRDRGLGQALLSSGERLLDDEADEGPGAGRGVEIAARQDPLHATEDVPGVGSRLGGYGPALVHDREPSRCHG